MEIRERRSSVLKVPAGAHEFVGGQRGAPGERVADGVSFAGAADDHRCVCADGGGAV